MNDAPIQIRNPEVVRAIRALAEKTGQPITEVVGEAVTALLDSKIAAEREDYERRLTAIQEISRRFRELPIVGPVLTDGDFYDEDGLPK